MTNFIKILPQYRDPASSEIDVNGRTDNEERVAGWWTTNTT